MSFEPVRFIATYQAAASRRDELRELLEASAAEARFEDGCIGADVLQDVRDPNRFLMIELWSDPDARGRYLDALEDAGALAPLTAACSKPPETRTYQKLT